MPLRGGGFFLKGFDFRAFLCYRLAFMNLRSKFIGRPPNWVSHEGTVHWTVPSPVLILWQAKGFRALRSSTKGFTLGFHSLLKKAGESFYVASLCLTLA